MLDMMFQHPDTVQCALFVWLGFHELYLFKETTPYLCFMLFNESENEFLFIFDVGGVNEGQISFDRGSTYQR